VVKGLSIPVQENPGIYFCNIGIIMSSLCQVFLSHDDTNIPGNTGFEVDVDNYSIPVKLDISPSHGPDYTDPKSSFIEHGDEGLVDAPDAGLDNRPDLIRSQESRCRFRYRFFRGVCFFLNFFSWMNEYSFSMSQSQNCFRMAT
jgi:hypothetical protein